MLLMLGNLGSVNKEIECSEGSSVVGKYIL